MPTLRIASRAAAPAVVPATVFVLAGILGAAVCASARADEAQADDDQPFAWKTLNDRSVELSEGGRPVFRYNFGPITEPSVPETDPRRTRACYIHPVWGLHGEVLTEDFPKDHYHHHGVFWTWPHVGIEGRRYDLWADRGIRQQFVAWLGRESTSEAAALGVENGWFVEDRKVMIERVWMRAHRASEAGRAIDLELTFIPVERPVTLQGAEGKSYGGLTVRFRQLPRKDVTITVPEGVTTEDLYETPLAWVDYTAKFPDAPGPSGATIMIPPSHPDFPPTWLTRHYGPQCIGWPGVKPRTFPPGEPIRLSYRLWIHKDAASPEELAKAYEAYKASLDAR
jgi:hypothetical protein